jgi:two-component system sensor histidine kinase RpfC
MSSLTKQTSVPTHVLCVAITLMTLVNSAETGGWQSPLHFYLAAVPILSTLLTDWPGGLFWTFSILATVSVAFFAEMLTASGAKLRTMVLYWCLEASLCCTVFALTLIYHSLLKFLIAELDRAVQDKSWLVAHVSHEIRTPIHGIRGLVDILANETALSPSYLVDIVSRLRGCSDLLLQFVNNVLDLGALQAGHLYLREADCSLHSVTEACFQLLRTLTAGKPLHCHLEFGAAVPERVVLDEARVSQVLVNFIGNAVKFSVSGDLYLRVLLLNAAELRFELEDSGPGIPNDVRQMLFQPYELLRPASGTGLGLAIARLLSELMGGYVGVDHLSSGSRFWLVVPFKRPPISTASNLPVAPRASEHHPPPSQS